MYWDFRSSLWFILENIPCALGKNLYSPVDGVLSRCQLGQGVDNVVFSVLADFVSSFSIYYWEWRYWNLQLLFLNCFLLKFCFMCFWTLLLGTCIHMFIAVIASWWIDLFIIIKSACLSLLTSFVLKSILSVVSIASSSSSLMVTHGVSFSILLLFFLFLIIVKYT